MGQLDSTCRAPTAVAACDCLPTAAYPAPSSSSSFEPPAAAGAAKDQEQFGAHAWLKRDSVAYTAL
jgi:hypothetical protein